jgi:hypothetical protein
MIFLVSNRFMERFGAVAESFGVHPSEDSVDSTSALSNGTGQLSSSDGAAPPLLHPQNQNRGTSIDKVGGVSVASLFPIHHAGSVLATAAAMAFLHIPPAAVGTTPPAFSLHSVPTIIARGPALDAREPPLSYGNTSFGPVGRYL